MLVTCCFYSSLSSLFYLLVYKLVHGGQGETEEADSRFVGGGLNKHGNLRSLSWVAIRQVDLCTCLLVLKVYTEALTGFSDTIHMVSTPYFLKAMSLQQLPLWEQ